MKTLLFVLLSMSLPAFAQHSHEDHAQHAKAKREALNESDKSEIADVLAKNDLLFNAFLRKDTSSIEKLSKDIQTSLAKSKSAHLSDVRAQATKLNIKAANKSEDNLKSYEALLLPLIKVVQRFEVDAKYNVFSCPMVKKSWLQNVQVNKDVKNVYAMDMLECGSQDTQF